LALSRNVIEAFDKADGGVHPGFRPVHAKGILLTGAFTLSSEAASLTRAPHIQQNSTLVTVRLSDRQSRRICAQELLNGIRVRASSIGGDQRVKEFQEIFRSARGEGVDGMSDDVAMDVFVKMEADGATARARILSIVIGDGRNSCERLCRLLSRSRPVLRRSCSLQYLHSSSPTRQVSAATGAIAYYP
jgi:hypothetical protein